MNTSAKGITLAEYGHPKVDEELPQVNISYATSAIDSKPLFYEIYPGSIILMIEKWSLMQSKK